MNWAEFTSELFDHDDSVRLDGAGFTAIPAGYGPVPNLIEATLDGGIGSDRIRGHKGPDAIAGRAGGDVVLGFGGADEIDPGDGRDEVDAGGGGDLVIVGEDGQRDKADCGPGQDQFNADTKDVVERCEIPVAP